MGRIIQTLAGFFTAGAAGTGVATPAPGDSFNPADFNSGSAWLENVSASGASTDWVRIRSPRMHDQQQGLRLWVGGNLRRNLLPWGNGQQVYKADNPTVEIDETAAATGGILVTYSYDDIGQNAATLATWDEISGNIDQTMAAEVDLAGGAIGAWSPIVGPNAFAQVFKADRMYAILGYTLSVACLGVKFTGPDTGNYGIGGPGDSDALVTREYFKRASQESGRPFIPIFKANNAGASGWQNVDVAANTATKMSMICALLRQ